MPNQPLEPIELITLLEIQRYEGFKVFDKIVVFEISHRQVAFFILQYSGFSSFRLKGMSEHEELRDALFGSILPADTDIINLDNVEHEILRKMPSAGEVVGCYFLGDDVVGAARLQERLGKKCKATELKKIGNDYLPDYQKLTQYTLEQPLTTNHSLTILGVSPMDGQHELLPDIIPLYSFGHRIDNPMLPIWDIDISPPALQQPFMLWFEELHNNGEVDPVVFWVIMNVHHAKLLIVCDESAMHWDIRFANKTQGHVLSKSQLPGYDIRGVRAETYGRIPRDTPRPAKRISVQEQQQGPQIVIAVESSLAMYKHYYAIDPDSTPPPNLTDFTRVQQLCQNIVDALSVYSFEFNCIFFGANNLPTEEYIPYRFTGSHYQIADPVVHTLGDGSFCDADTMQERIEKEFRDNQTLAKTFHVSVDEALHFLNHEIAWTANDRYVIWIAQSPGFLNFENDIPLEKFGFTSKYNYIAELQELRRKGVQNYIIFLDNQFKQGLFDAMLYNEAENFWSEIAGSGQRCIPHQCANEQDESIPDSFWEIINIIHEKPIITVYKGDQPLDLPFIANSYQTPREYIRVMRETENDG